MATWVDHPRRAGLRGDCRGHHVGHVGLGAGAAALATIGVLPMMRASMAIR
jgi:hypothetical protein